MLTLVALSRGMVFNVVDAARRSGVDMPTLEALPRGMVFNAAFNAAFNAVDAVGARAAGEV